jgi:hypothetical protein
MSKRNLWLSALFTAVVGLVVNLAVSFALRRTLNLGDLATSLAIGLTTGVAVFLAFRNWKGGCRYFSSQVYPIWSRVQMSPICHAAPRNFIILSDLAC